jgi:hypothetical protein
VFLGRTSCLASCARKDARRVEATSACEDQSSRVSILLLQDGSSDAHQQADAYVPQNMCGSFGADDPLEDDHGIVEKSD